MYCKLILDSVALNVKLSHRPLELFTEKKTRMVGAGGKNLQSPNILVTSIGNTLAPIS